MSSKPLKEVQSRFPTATNKPSFLQDQASQEESTHLLTLTCAHCYSGSLTLFLARSLPFMASTWIVKWSPGIKAKISLSLNKEESPDLLEAFYTITQSLLITLCVVLYYYLHTNDFYFHISRSHLSQSPTSVSLHLNVPLMPQTRYYPNWTYLFPLSSSTIKFTSNSIFHIMWWSTIFWNHVDSLFYLIFHPTIITSN